MILVTWHGCWCQTSCLSVSEAADLLWFLSWVYREESDKEEIEQLFSEWKTPVGVRGDQPDCSKLTKPTQQHLLQSRYAEEYFWLHNTLKLIADRLLQQKTALGDALSPWEMQTESTIRTNSLKLDIRRLEFFCFFRWRYDRMSLNFCCNIQILELEYKHHESMDCS